MNFWNKSILKECFNRCIDINGRDEYFNSVILVLLVYIENEYHIVFQKRAKNIRQSGEICLPGGIYEEQLDKDREKTAIRETVEELGIKEEKIEIIGKLDTIITLMGMLVDVFVGIADITMEDMNINKDEVEEVFTLPISFFENNDFSEYKVMVKLFPSVFDEKTNQEVILFPSKELGLHERYHKSWGGYKQKVIVYKTSYGVIWGITARAIKDFMTRLKKHTNI